MAKFENGKNKWSIVIMWVKQCHKPSPSHHHKYIAGIDWYSINHSQSWVVYCFTHIDNDSHSPQTVEPQVHGMCGGIPRMMPCGRCPGGPMTWRGWFWWWWQLLTASTGRRKWGHGRHIPWFCPFMSPILLPYVAIYFPPKKNIPVQYQHRFRHCGNPNIFESINQNTLWNLI